MTLKQMAFAVTLLLAFHTGAAKADGTFIPAANRTDMVYDAQRDLIYIANGSSVLRYDVTAGAFLSPLNLGGQLEGVDLSPDGNTLAVADAACTSTNSWVHLVNLNTLVDTKAMYTLPGPDSWFSLEAGTYAVAFAADGSLLVTSEFNGSGWVPLLHLNPSSGQWTSVASSIGIRQNSMVSASGDGKTIAIAESNISDGRWGFYSLASGQFTEFVGTLGTGWFNYEIAANADGSQFSIPTYGGTFFVDTSANELATLGTYAGQQPIGVAYHPVEPEVFLPWEGTSEVRVYDTKTFTQTGSFDFVDTFTSNGNYAFVDGRTRLSRDGSLLMVSVTGGVRFLRMYSPLAAQAVVTTIYYNHSTGLIPLKGSIGDSGTLTYSVASQPRYGTVTINGNTATYMATEPFIGTDSFTYQVHYGMATAEAPVTIIRNSQTSPIANNDYYLATSREPMLLPVLANDQSPGGAPLNIVAVTRPSQGSAVIQGNEILYIPPANFSSVASFRYTISNGLGGTASAGVTVQPAASAGASPIPATPIVSGSHVLPGMGALQKP
ncbi:Ig-like domain-containing protein [Rhodanobacter hydrolyticus]|uniref:Uncharacterized protein n=1 Tax=Rhodanobacter hydrolyticus TaxID=2250595 RepID=A0ABW8J6S0_9GAMM